MRRPAGPLRAERRPRVRRAKPRPAFKVWRELEPVPSPRSRLKEAGTATYSKGLCGRALISRARVVNQLFHWIGSAKGRGLANPHEAPRPLQHPRSNSLHTRRSCGANSAAGLRACRDDVTATKPAPRQITGFCVGRRRDPRRRSRRRAHSRNQHKHERASQGGCVRRRAAVGDSPLLARAARPRNVPR